MDATETPPAAEALLQQRFAAQRRAFGKEPYPTLAERRERLRLLKRQLCRYQDRLTTAMADDFGWRAPFESRTIDVLAPVLAINHARKHLSGWMQPSYRHTELLFAGNSLHVSYQPKGVVGVISPWNFPVYLSVGPLIAALAAGNRVMLKLSEATPATNDVLRGLLGEIFPLDLVSVFGEELRDPKLFSALPFDHLVFTGSTAVGREVMIAAAANLTPVTLELGGKCPAIVLDDYPVSKAALRIVHGKCLNAGQICVAPDYALLPRNKVVEFTAAAKQGFASLYGQIGANEDYTALINERHAARLQNLLDDAQAKGAQIIACGDDGPGRKFAPRLVLGCRPDMQLMQQEIFGPILPVITYDTLDEAIAFVQSRPRPLALYAFSFDAQQRDRLLRATQSGGVSINDWGWHVLNHDAPFGGIGASGTGSYHGEEGFREMSHARTVFRRNRFFPIWLFYPPYGTAIQRLIFRALLGRPDPNAGATAPRRNSSDTH
jgi:coniferyl-aldehyde dehydrogenase